MRFSPDQGLLTEVLLLKAGIHICSCVASHCSGLKWPVPTLKGDLILEDKLIPVGNLVSGGIEHGSVLEIEGDLAVVPLDQPVHAGTEYIHLFAQTLEIRAGECKIWHQLAVVPTEQVFGQQVSDLPVPEIACAEHRECVAAADDTGARGASARRIDAVAVGPQVIGSVIGIEIAQVGGNGGFLDFVYGRVQIPGN